MNKKAWVRPSFDDEVTESGPPKKKYCAGKPETIEKPDELKASKVLKSCTWLENSKPASVSDLAPTKSKISELENWLMGHKNCQLSSKYLLLTGPSGCGKTSSVHTLAKHLGFKIIEWITPIDKVKWIENEEGNLEEQVESQTKVFADFLIRGSRYKSVLSSSQQNSRLILVKDFPNAFLKKSEDFHEILTEFHNKVTSPVIFITDGKKASKLFPSDVLSKLSISQISFSPICFRTVKTILQKLLKSNKISIPSDDALKEIYLTSGSDLRNSILQTYYVYSAKKPVSKFTFSKKTQTSSESTDNRIELFQTTGRVFYPKLQTVLSKYGYNILKFTHDPEQMIGFYETNRTDVRYLHHNYVDTFSSIADISKAADYLSTSDMLWASYSDSRLTNQTYAYSIAVRGFMVSNKKCNKGYRQFNAPDRSKSLLENSDYLKEARKVLTSIQGRKDLILDYAPFLKSSLFSLLDSTQKKFIETYFIHSKKKPVNYL